MSIWYRIGTVAVTNGSPTVTGTLTAFTNQGVAGDSFLGPDGKDYEIASVDSNTQLTLATNYAGSTASGQSYAVKRYSTEWSDVAKLSLKISDFLQTIAGVYGGTGAPNNSLGNDGDYYFRDDDPKLYKKTSGAWDSGLSLVGPQGDVGPGFATTSTTSNSIGTGTKVFTIPDAGAPYLGARMRAASTASPTNYLEGIVTAVGANSVTITSDLTGGSGTIADWALVATGNRGATGATGAPNSGTSTTSNSIGTGTKTFTVADGLDLVIGQRVRFADAADPATNWLEGVITAYSSTSLSVLSDLTAGSGTKTSWSLGLTGSRGATGPTGATGLDSTVPGPTYAATSATNSVALGTGTKTLVIATGLPYQGGERVRAADAANVTTKYMEGVVTGYTTGSLQIAVDLVVGSGTPSSWVVGLAGDPGTDGADGTSPLSTGDYNGATTYNQGDMARDGGATWQYINASSGSGNAPPTLPTEANSYWQLVAMDGADGAGNVDSVNGATGTVVLEATDIEVIGIAAAPAGSSIEAHLSALYGISAINPNVLINPDGYINQRGATTADDAAYHVDRWYALVQTASIGISQLSDVADGVPSMIRLTQSNATAQRIGSAQAVEGIVSRDFRGKEATLSGKVRMSAAATVRFAIIEWTDTEDVITKDVVNTSGGWANGTFTAGQFFASSNLTIAGVGSLALAANTVTDFELSATISSACKNLIVFLWSDATMAQTATLDFRAKLEVGGSATPYVTPRPSVELDSCYRYYQAISPSSNGTVIGFRLATAYCIGAGFGLLMKMRTTPSISSSSPSWTTVGPGSNNKCAFRLSSGAYATISGAFTLSLTGGVGPLEYSLTYSAGTSFSGSAGDVGQMQMGAGVTIYADAEL